MAIVRWDPFREMNNMVRKMNDFLGDVDFGARPESGGFLPAVDISEDERNIYMNVELPGVEKEAVKIKIMDDNVLVISGEKKREIKEENKSHSYLRIERSYGEFTRSFVLPENANKDKVDAKYDNGMLHLTIEKKEPETPKEKLIEIK